MNDETDRYPGLYSGHYIKDLLDTNSDPILDKCWFWLSQYGPTAVVPANWPTWIMWQYTDGAVGPRPHSVPGAGLCGRDKFNGDEASLRAHCVCAITSNATFRSFSSGWPELPVGQAPTCLPWNLFVRQAYYLAGGMDHVL